MAKPKLITFTGSDLYFKFATYMYDGLVSGVALYKNRPVYLNAESKRKGGDNWKCPRTYAVRYLTDEQYYNMKSSTDRFTKFVSNSMLLNPDGSFVKPTLVFPANTQQQFYDTDDITSHMKTDKFVKENIPIIGWFKFDENFVYCKELQASE